MFSCNTLCGLCFNYNDPQLDSHHISFLSTELLTLLFVYSFIFVSTNIHYVFIFRNLVIILHLYSYVKQICMTVLLHQEAGFGSINIRLTTSLFIEMTLQSHGSECVRSIIYIFRFGFWNCSGGICFLICKKKSVYKDISNQEIR